MLWSRYEAHLGWQRSAHMTTQRVWSLHWGGQAAALCGWFLVYKTHDWTEWVTLSVELSVWCCTIVPPSSRKESLSKQLLYATNCAFYSNTIRGAGGGGDPVPVSVTSERWEDFRRGKPWHGFGRTLREVHWEGASLTVWMIVTKWMVSMTQS